jgi:hypothetical protein
VLYPAYLCDTLLRLAEAEAYPPLWSADVFTELRRNLIERGLAPERVDRRIAQMCRSFPDATVTGCCSNALACRSSRPRCAGTCDMG